MFDRVTPGLEASLVDSNVLVAIAVAALHRFVVLHLGLDVPLAADAVIVGSTLALYGVDRLFDRVVEGERRATRSPMLVGASVIAGLVLVAWGLSAAPVAARWLVGIGALVSTTYGLPLRRRDGLRGWVRLKDFPGVKSWMVAASVSVAVVSVPTVWSGTPFDARAGVTAAMLFALAAANAHLFDVRDVDWDRRLDVPTIPVVHGVERARRLILGLLVFASVLAGIDALFVAGPPGFGVVASAAMIAPLAWRGGPDSPRLVWPLVADGALVVPWLVALVAG